MPDIHEGVSWCATKSIPLHTKTPVMSSKSTVPALPPAGIALLASMKPLPPRAPRPRRTHHVRRAPRALTARGHVRARRASDVAQRAAVRQTAEEWQHAAPSAVA